MSALDLLVCVMVVGCDTWWLWAVTHGGCFSLSCEQHCTHIGGTRTHIVCYICCLSVSCDHHNYDNCILAVYWTSLHNYLHCVWREALVSLLVIIINCVCGSSWMERYPLGYFDCITWSAVADRIFVRMGLTCCTDSQIHQILMLIRSSHDLNEISKSSHDSSHDLNESSHDSSHDLRESSHDSSHDLSESSHDSSHDLNESSHDSSHDLNKSSV